MSRPLNVLQLASPTGLYGAERWILALIRNLDPTRVVSSVAAIRDDPGLTVPICTEARALGLETRILDAPGRVNFAAVRLLRAALQDHRIDILHTHGYKTDLVGLLATRGTGCRIVTTPHGWSTRAGFKLRVYEGLDRAAFPFFDAVVPLSDSLHEGLSRLPFLGSRLQFIRNAVDVSEVDATTTIAPLLQQWRSEGDFVVGYIGQLISRKGLDTLIEAFRRFQHPRKRLVLLGDGPQRGELEQAVHDAGLGEQVFLPGFRPDRLSWLRGFDVFALASRLEGVPRCLMEAMAAGVPIVTTDIPGCRDLVDHGRTGLLVPVDDPGALAGALDRLRDASLRRRLADEGRTELVERYSAQRMAREYEALYQRLASPP